jgi:molecular chaperone Hsp33
MPEGRVTLAPSVGRSGVVNVVRDLGLKENYQGQTMIVTGEIDEDVEGYLRTSEQVPSALACEVLLGPDQSIVAAAGLLLQALPGGDPNSVREVQHALRTGALHDLLVAGERSASEIVNRLVPGVEFLGGERAVRFQCRCSVERILDMLKLLTIVDLDEMIAEDKPAEVTCNYCNTRYAVGRAELERIRDEVKGAPRERN